MTSATESDLFTIIGHRGAAGLAPENTLASFARGLDLGCSMLELDVHRVFAEDGSVHLCVIHDDQLERTTNGVGAVADHSLEALKALDAGSGQAIPTLQEVIELLEAQSDRVRLNVELKGKNTAALVATTLSCHSNLSYLVSSFDHAQLEQFRSIDPWTAVAPLFHRWDPAALTIAESLHADAINLSVRAATSERIELLRDAGYSVYVYTVNQPDEAAQLRLWGASGVFTDFPDRLIKRTDSRESC